MNAFNNLVKGGLALAAVCSLAVFVLGQSLPPLESADPWTAGQLVEVEHVAKAVSGPHNNLLIFYVGPAVLYKKAHIPGAKFVGPPAEPGALKNLQQQVRSLPRDSELFLYCGCCPWKVCPNVRPAFRALQSMGFKKVRVVYFPNNFTLNWTNKGFPVLKGE